MKQIPLSILGFYLILLSCKKEAEVNPEPKPYTKTIAVGYEETSASTIRAIYWVNGQQKILSDELSIAVNVLIHDYNIYITGYNNRKPAYWKNGEINYLPFKNTYGSTNKMTFHNENQYITGVDGQNIVVWKNGELFKTLPRKDSFTYYRYVMHQDDLYYTSSEIIDGDTIASYWKNETQFLLTDVKGAIIPFIEISNNDVYVAGSNKNNSELYVWKNNVKTTIAKREDTSKNILNISSLAADGNDIYVFYTIQNPKNYAVTYKILKNGAEYNLFSDGLFFPSFHKVINGDIYRGGGSAGATYFLNSTKEELNRNLVFQLLDVAVGKVK